MTFRILRVLLRETNKFLVIPMKFRFSYLILLIVIATLGSCQMGRFIYYNFADITDYKIFPKRELHSNTEKFTFQTTDKGRFPKTLTTGKENKVVPFESFLEEHNTVAFLIIRNDTIQYEKYFNKYKQSDVIASFSMAKSVTSILIGCAIDDGLIKSVEEPVIQYIPELAKNGFSDLKIIHLLQMTSGIQFNESYVNPFGDAASIYYGRNLDKEIKHFKRKCAPGVEFEYKSGDPQILGLLLQRALKGKSITEYLQEKLWTPLGMEYDASWSIDKKSNGLEKTFCCINARARDFAKIGRLYLNKGKWNGKQIVSEKWVTESTKVDTSNGSAKYYQYQWWLPSPNGDFMAQGILGQYVYVNPAKNLILVRLGKSDGGVNWQGMFLSFAKAL